MCHSDRKDQKYIRLANPIELFSLRENIIELLKMRDILFEI